MSAPARRRAEQREWPSHGPAAEARSVVGTRVREVRRMARMTQVQLAHRMHVSISYVRHVEQGHKAASPSFVAAAARALGVAPGDLDDGERGAWVDPAEAPRDAAAIEVLTEVLTLLPVVVDTLGAVHVENGGVCGGCNAERWPCPTAYAVRRAEWLQRVRGGAESGQTDARQAGGLGGRVRALRTALWLTQANLAAAADVSLDVVRKLEQGQRTTASVETLRRLAAALDVAPGQLLGSG